MKCWKKTLHFLETAAVFLSEPAYNLPCDLVKKLAKISFLSAGITLGNNRAANLYTCKFAGKSH